MARTTFFRLINLEKGRKKNSKLIFLVESIRNHWVIFLVVFLWLLSLIFRIIFALTTYGFIFSDEIIQSKEMAHKWLYGFGYVPWEFQIPSDTQKEGAARSPLHGLFYALFFILGDFLNLPWSSTVILITIIDAIVSSFMVPLIYLVSCQIVKKSQEIAIFATLMTVTWFWMIYIGAHSFSNVYYAPLIYLALWLILRSSYRKPRNTESEKLIDFNKKTESYPSYKMKSIQYWIAGISLGLAFCLRVDSLVYFILFIIIYYRIDLKQLKIELTLIWFFLFGFFVTGILVVGILDLWIFGVFWISPWNNFVFNIIQDKARIFVNRPFFWYFDVLLGKNSPFLPFIYLLLILLLIQVCIVGYLSYINKRAKFFLVNENIEPLIESYSSLPPYWIKLPSVLDQTRVFLVALSLLFFFSITPNKQLRFIYPWLPFFFIILSLSIILLNNFLQLLLSLIPDKIHSIRLNKHTMRNFGLFLILICSGSWFTAFQYQSVQIQSKTPINAWGDVMMAMVWIGEQDDSKGLLVFGAIHFGFFHLHKDIPVLYYYFLENSADYIQNGIKALSELDKSTYNYAIVPKYSFDQEPEFGDTPTSIYNFYPFLDDSLVLAGYKIIHYTQVGDNVCEIWKFG